MKIEVRATGLKAVREKCGLTLRKLAHDLGSSQNYIPAIEAGARKARPKLQDQLVRYSVVPSTTSSKSCSSIQTPVRNSECTPGNRREAC